MGVANHGIAGFVSIEESPITNPCIKQNNNKYQTELFLQEKTKLSNDLGDLFGNTIIAAIVGPNPPIT
jgi:hypothetical protein